MYYSLLRFRAGGFLFSSNLIRTVFALVRDLVALAPWWAGAFLLVV
nr:MAG TPA: hypothetical protein [Caudoviricetes sp.]